MCGVRIFAPRPEKRTFSIVSRVAGMVQILCLKSISLQRQGGIVIFNRRRGDAFQMQRRIVFSQPLLNGVTHDVAE